MASTPGFNQIDLDWGDNTEGDLASYNVYRDVNPGSGVARSIPKGLGVESEFGARHEAPRPIDGRFKNAGTRG